MGNTNRNAQTSQLRTSDHQTHIENSKCADRAKNCPECMYYAGKLNDLTKMLKNTIAELDEKHKEFKSSDCFKDAKIIGNK